MNNNAMRGGARKICFHKSEKVTLFAIGCITLKAGGRFYWDRERQFTSFKVKVYEKRSLFDKYLYTRGMPFDTGEIVIGAGSRFDFSRFKKPVNRYVLRVCNTQYDDKVQFSLAADTPRGQFSEGWWSVERGSCKTVPFGKRLKDSWNIPYGQNLRLFYRARTFGKKTGFLEQGRSCTGVLLQRVTEICGEIGERRFLRGAADRIDFPRACNALANQRRNALPDVLAERSAARGRRCIGKAL